MRSICALIKLFGLLQEYQFAGTDTETDTDTKTDTETDIETDTDTDTVNCAAVSTDSQCPNAT